MDFVDLDVHRGETLALVGESGCGKTTLARLILRLIPASAGSVRFEHLDVLSASEQELGPLRRRAQLVFQDPYGSLDPRMKVDAIVSEGMSREGTTRRERHDRVCELLELVELPAAAGTRYPHEFSGGERQRISIARALAVNPTFLIADEPVSALDMSVRSRILNLLADLQERLELTYLFISHDMSVVRHVADRVAVMYLGKVVETAPTAEIFESPLHPYTQALLSSAPALSRARARRPVVLQGEGQGAVDPPVACRFAERCFRPIDRCFSEIPLHDGIAGDASHRVACFNFAPLAGPDALPAKTDPPAPRPVSARTALPVRARWVMRFVASRLVYTAVLLLLASMILFAGLTGTSGSHVTVDAGDRARMGLDRPVGTQYGIFLKNLLSGDPGNSFQSGAKIASIVRDGAAKTLRLGFAAALLVFALGIPLGLVSAWRRNSKLDGGARVFAVLAMGVPNFFLAILLIQLFALKLGWLPVAGSDGLDHLVLPAVVLALESVAITARLTRSSMLDELSRDYVRSLRAKGLSTWRVVCVHALRNAIVPVVAFAGTLIPLLLGYTLVVEVVFRYEGLGYQLVQAIANRDYVLGTTLALIFTAVVIFSNFAADLGHRLIDPRLREAGTR